MFGFIVGTACLMGLIFVVRKNRSRFHGQRGGHAGPFGAARNFALSSLLDRLQATPLQEKVIREAFEGLHTAARDTMRDIHATRNDVARAVRGNQFDATLMSEVLAQGNAAFDRLREELIRALARVHEELEPEQRERLADWITTEHGWDRFRGGPYRCRPERA